MMVGDDHWRTPNASATWVASWLAPPAPRFRFGFGPLAVLATPSLDGQTIVQRVRLALGGARLRLRFDNAYGKRAAAIGAVRVGRSGLGGPAPLTDMASVSFSGEDGVVVKPGASVLSDPVALPTACLSTLEIRLYASSRTGPLGGHPIGLASADISRKGDYTAQAFEPARTTGARVLLSEVHVEAPAPAHAVVAFGDSITDGYASTPDANRRWPDIVAERLASEGGAPRIGIVNAGISGNRVLKDGFLSSMGESALRRFERDVLGQPGVRTVVILEGINDIQMGRKRPPTAQALIDGYLQLIQRARAQSVRVVGATLIPYGGAKRFRLVGEAVRQEVNGWLRGTPELDGVIDFDRAMADPSDPSRMREALHCGDGLHPNDAGYHVMGQAVDLSLLR